MIFCDLCAFLWLSLFLDRGDLHLTGVVLNSEINLIVDGDAVQHAGVCHRKLHLHCRHEALDVSMIDLDGGSTRIQTLHDPDTMIRI